jgi:alkaline phosphatase D
LSLEQLTHSYAHVVAKRFRDDHEVSNNWYGSEVLGEPKYPNGTEVDTLAANSLQAFYEFNPLANGQQIYRTQRFGKHLEVFFPDYRSFRDPNTDNNNPDGIAIMGEEQLAFFKEAILSSTATWKVISSHDPVRFLGFL